MKIIGQSARPRVFIALTLGHNLLAFGPNFPLSTVLGRVGAGACSTIGGLVPALCPPPREAGGANKGWAGCRSADSCPHVGLVTMVTRCRSPNPPEVTSVVADRNLLPPFIQSGDIAHVHITSRGHSAEQENSTSSRPVGEFPESSRCSGSVSIRPLKDSTTTNIHCTCKVLPNVENIFSTFFRL